MGVYSGSLSYVRYRAGADAPDTIKEFVLQRLTANAFREIDPGSLNEKSTGWVSCENMASTAFDDLHFAKDPFLVFSLRSDVRKIPALTRKAALLREEIRYREATGKERISKKDRDMLKDEVWQSLMKKALPAPSVNDVCWNLQSGIVLFFSTSGTANDDFTSFFFRSFDIKLTPLLPYELAQELGARKNRFFDVVDAGLQTADG